MEKIGYKQLKPIFDLFVDKGLYLPKYQLQKIYNDKSFNKKKIDEYIKYNPKLKWYTDKSTAGYSTKFQDWYKEVPRKIIGVNIETKKISTFNSIYQAAKELNLFNGCGNICLALQRAENDGKGIAYGYEWQYAN